MRNFICTIIFIVSSIAAYAEDTIPTYLNELIVESKHSWVENDRVVFVPTKKEKNLAYSPETLIMSMNVPFIKVKDGIMSDLRGESVAVFVNGVQLTEAELSTFIAKDVTRVEYYSNPSDPKFKGLRAVVNFITPVYMAGGVTKLNTRQSLPNYSGRYTVSSKLVYKQMTYGVMVDGSTGRFDTRQESREDYKNIW